MKMNELLAEEAKDVGTLEITDAPDGDGFVVRCTVKSGPMLSGIYWVWSLVGRKRGVKSSIMAVHRRGGKPVKTELTSNDGTMLINKRTNKITFSGIDREDLRNAVSKAIAKVEKSMAADAKRKEEAPARKVQMAKLSAEKRKEDLAEYAKKYGKGTWNRVTYRQEGGDDGYAYVVRVDGHPKWNGLTQRQAMYYKER
jgi:hypothetical protein